MVHGVTLENRSIQYNNYASMSEVLGHIETSQIVSEDAYQILNRHYGFQAKAETAQGKFAEMASARLMSDHKVLVVDLKAQLQERKEARRSVLASIREALFGSLKGYCKDLRLAWSMTDSKDRNLKTLGWEVTTLKTLGYLPYFTGIICATACVVSAIALPFFATSIGVVGVGAVAHSMGYCFGAAGVDLGLGYMHKCYMDLMWEDELSDFADYRLEDFMKRQLMKGFDQLQDKVNPATYGDLKHALANL